MGAAGVAGLSAGAWLAGSSTWRAQFLRERALEPWRGIRLPPTVPTPSRWNENAVTTAWIGHSTLLINFYGLRILTDPVFGPRIGPDLRLFSLGPKRFVRPALPLEALPPVDILLLSHAHFDHFDVATLRRFPADLPVVTAKGTRDLFRGLPFRSVTETGWGDRLMVSTRTGKIALEAIEAKHWGGRWGHAESRGYNGYLLEREGRKLLFAGDTGWTQAYSHLRAKGPFDLAMMPIGAYNPWKVMHCNPEQAVAMANLAGARHLLPIHHQTFHLSEEPGREPIERFLAALDRERERIALREIGETFCFN